jgi:hypothetical protein
MCTGKKYPYIKMLARSYISSSYKLLWRSYLYKWLCIICKSDHEMLDPNNNKVCRSHLAALTCFVSSFCAYTCVK